MKLSASERKNINDAVRNVGDALDYGLWHAIGGIADDDTRHAFQKAFRENRKVPVFEALYDLVNGQEKLC